jgi:hypothetical protein
MKRAQLAAFGWLVPGGGYLLTRRYVQFGISLSLVLAASVSGVALGGGNLWPQSTDLQGVDSLTLLLSKAGAITKLLAGAPYLLARLCGYAQSPFNGRLHEYGTTLLVIAGLINLLALADAIE